MELLVLFKIKKSFVKGSLKMKILVVNCGSSSLKYQLIDMEGEKLLAKGNFERIGEKESFVTHKVGGEKYVIKTPVNNHEEALKIVLEQLIHKDYGVIKDLSEISAVGHRLVHGGELFSESVVITEEVIDKYESCASLAPLHNPATILGIRACQKAMPNVPMVGVFDTAFHQTMPKQNYLYPIPYEYYEKYRIRKYGFHGTSHQYVSKIAMELMGKEESKIVTCHLGQRSFNLCNKKWKIYRYFNGTFSFRWNSNGYSFWRFGSISCYILNGKREHESISNGRNVK